MRADLLIHALSSVVILCTALPETPHPGERIPLRSPSRPLEWKEVNFLSTSDTHGWLLGHQHATWPEPNYSGDYGDLASFVTHMRAIAEHKGVDLLLVDAGDHHDGSGIVSASPESAKRTDDIFAMLEYDIMTVGNHELYSWEGAKDIYDRRGSFGGRYLTSNVNLTIWEDGEWVWKAVAERVRKFVTKRGKRVTAFGVIFDFQDHGANLTVQSPTLMAKEDWFLNSIEEAPDLFLLAGHMPARGETAEWQPILAAIRAKHPHVPIYVFGGHSHVRDCTQYDDWSIGVTPGRYMETVAFTSSSIPSSLDGSTPLQVARRYLDANRRTYKFHTNTSHADFDTSLGRNISISLLKLAASLNISTPLGKAPHDFFLARYPYGHPESVLTEWTDGVMPATVVDKKRKGEKVIIAQSGSLRFDLFQGRFDRNDELTVSPFPNKFAYIPLPVSLARNITYQMNLAGPSRIATEKHHLTREEEDQRVERIYQEWLMTQWTDYASANQEGGDQLILHGQRGQERTLGYVTKDACPGRGDDIEHIPVPVAWNQPAFLQSPFPEYLAEDEEIDVVIMEFSQTDFIAAINTLDPTRKVTANDLKPYAAHTDMKNMWGDYAAIAWR